MSIKIAFEEEPGRVTFSSDSGIQTVEEGLVTLSGPNISLGQDGLFTVLSNLKPGIITIEFDEEDDSVILSSPFEHVIQMIEEGLYELYVENIRLGVGDSFTIFTPKPPRPSFEIDWDAPGQRYFETGVDRGVLYVDHETSVPWNGITSVSEKTEYQTAETYFDGLKVSDHVTSGAYAAVLKAFTYPDEFADIEGIIDVEQGLHLGGQTPKVFDLSYRSRVGNDINGVDLGYKIHILYNLTAVPSNKLYDSMGEETTPTEFSWDIYGIPEEVPGHRPTAHVILDSTKTDPLLLAIVEDILYGTQLKRPTLPRLVELLSIFAQWSRLDVVDHGDGTWSATSDIDGTIEFVDDEETEFRIIYARAKYLNRSTYTLSDGEKPL